MMTNGTPADEKRAAQKLSDILAHCYGVTANGGSSVWERYARYIRSAWGLTARETEVAVLCLQGKRDHQIALDLGLSVETIETHLKKSFSRAGVRTRAELAAAVLDVAQII